MKKFLKYIYLLPYILVMLILAGCSYTWSGNINGDQFIWKQVPQISFYTSMVFWAGALVFSYVQKSSGCAGIVLIIMFLALMPVILPRKIIIDNGIITMKYPFTSFKKNREIRFDNIKTFEIYNNSTSYTKRYGQVGTLGKSGEIDFGILIKDEKSEISIPFAKYKFDKSFGGLIVNSVFKYLLFMDGFIVNMETRNAIILEFRKRLPGKISDGIKWNEIEGDNKYLLERYQ
jgi:hypothetical protein